MSRGLALYRYPETPQGRYVEETAQKIAECFIDDRVLGEIEDLEPWAKLEVFEERDDDTSNGVECLDNAKLGEIKRRLTALFVSRVREANQELDARAELDIPITELRTICNLLFLLRLKLEKYETDDRAVIQLV